MKRTQQIKTRWQRGNTTVALEKVEVHACEMVDLSVRVDRLRDAVGFVFVAGGASGV